jgi:hypothetical protein
LAGSARSEPPTLRSGDTLVEEDMTRGPRPLDQDVPVSTVPGSLEGAQEMSCPPSQGPLRGDPEFGMADVVASLVREILDVQMELQASLTSEEALREELESLRTFTLGLEATMRRALPSPDLKRHESSHERSKKSKMNSSRLSKGGTRYRIKGPRDSDDSSESKGSTSLDESPKQWLSLKNRP